MKNLILLLIILNSFYVKAQIRQKPTPAQTDEQSSSPLYIVDGTEIEKSKALKIEPAVVADIQILKTQAEKEPYGDKGANGVLLITTRKFAIASYQEKFSTFSNDFKSYISGHGTDDSQIVYVIDGEAVPKDKNEAAKLFHLNKEIINTVKFTQSEPEGSKTLARVIVTTKK